MSADGATVDNNMQSSSDATIVVDNVSKWFGNVVAVNEVSLEFGPGITGLLGPNGAGKTTLLHMMTGLSATSRGSVTVLGRPVRGDTGLYREIGVMTEHQAVYDFYTGREFVELSARMHKTGKRPPSGGQGHRVRPYVRRAGSPPFYVFTRDAATDETRSHACPRPAHPCA